MNNIQWTVAAVLTVMATIAHSALPASTNELQLAQTPSWETIFGAYAKSRDRRDPGRGSSGGGRPTDLCLISPDRNIPVWNSNPLFVWQGKIGAIGVRQAGNSSVLWRQEVPAGSNRLRYTGKPLQSGQRYEWLIFSHLEPDSDTPIFWSPFQLMTSRDLTSTTTDLTALEKQLKANGLGSEAIALQRANYLAQRQLWSDVMQEAFSINQPSANLQTIVKQWTQQVCGARSSSK